MSNFEALGEHQIIANGVQALILARIDEATPVEVLSARGNKLLQVMQEADGTTFVTRSFTAAAVNHVEQRRISFAEAWDAMHSVYGDAGIDVVPSYLLASNGKYPFVAVSEHLVSGQHLIDAPTETKVDLAESFASLIQPNRDGHFIAPEMINEDMFQVVSNEEGEFRVVLVDTDPHILPNMYNWRDENLVEHYLKALTDLFWDKWCHPEEREEVFSKLFQVMSKTVGEDFDLMSKPGLALQQIHMMSNGVDIRDMPLFK